MGPGRTDVDNEQVRQLRLLGTGAANPTVEFGREVTVVRQSAGLLRITFASPGTFIAIRGYVFGAATPGDVKGQTLTRKTYTAATSTAAGFLDVAIWSSTFAADDLQATEYLDLALVFTA